MAETAATNAADRALLIAAIDFGTSYSGMAYSFRSEFEKDPNTVHCLNLKTEEHGREMQSQKVPTCILFKPDKQFHSFGFEAQKTYSQMASDDQTEAEKWYYFKDFKMKLLSSKELTRDMPLLDDTSRKHLKAVDVFSAAILYLKNTLEKELETRQSHVITADIMWILTVPAIWDDAARQFMREAAIKAGIAGEKLRLALEPEVASVFCHFHFRSVTESFTEKGRRFLTVDCGGGTVDISAFAVSEVGTLKQLHRPHGAGCGGRMVDQAFYELLFKILTMDGVSAFNKIELVDLMQDFEISKENMGSGKEVFVKLPKTLKESFECHLRHAEWRDQVKIVGPNLRLPREIFEPFFNKSKEGIIKAIKEVLSNETVGPVDVLLLVGGLAKSTIIENAVKAAFPDRRVLVPPSPDLTVLMGAVQFGHCPEAIATRVSPYTYGISTTYVSRPGDDPSKVEEVDGVERTKDIFEGLIKVNETVSIDEARTPHSFRPTHPNQKKMKLDLYRTLSPDPKYVTDAGCEKVASIEVDMPDTTGDKRRRVQVSLSVSGTELRVVAKDGKTGKTFSTECDFLEDQGRR